MPSIFHLSHHLYQYSCNTCTSPVCLIDLVNSYVTSVTSSEKVGHYVSKHLSPTIHALVLPSLLMSEFLSWLLYVYPKLVLLPHIEECLGTLVQLGRPSYD